VCNNYDTHKATQKKTVATMPGKQQDEVKEQKRTAEMQRLLHPCRPDLTATRIINVMVPCLNYAAVIAQASKQSGLEFS
jgi:hypothetical protein